MNFWEVFGGYLLYYIQTNLPLFAICFAMLAILWKSKVVGTRDVSGYRLVTCALLVSSFIEALDHYIEGLGIQAAGALVTHRFIAASFSYMFKPVVPMLVLFGIYRSHKKKISWQWIPVAVYLAIFTVNIFLPMKFFNINETNDYVRDPNWGWLTFSSFVLSFFYLILIVANSFNIFTDRTAGELIGLISIVLSVCTAHIIESVFEVFNLGNQVSAIGVLFFYLFIVIKYGKIDPLTGLFTRATFFDHQERYKKFAAVISIDMNNLKYYNDNFGHAKGDEALETIGKEIRAVSSSNVHPFRMGGDEFLILTFNMSEEQVRILVSKLQFAINKNTEYDIAIGYAYRHNNEPLRYSISQADAVMYEQKTQMKKDIFHVKKNRR